MKVRRKSQEVPLMRSDRHHCSAIAKEAAAKNMFGLTELTLEQPTLCSTLSPKTIRLWGERKQWHLRE